MSTTALPLDEVGEAPVPSVPPELAAELRIGRRFEHRKMKDARRQYRPAVFEITGVTMGAVHIRLVTPDPVTGVERLGHSAFLPVETFVGRALGRFLDAGQPAGVSHESLLPANRVLDSHNQCDTL